MTRARRIVLYWLFLSGGISVLWGLIEAQATSGGMADLQAIYYGARCLIQHQDPYNEAGFLRVFYANGGRFPSDPGKSKLLRRAIPVCINLPTALVIAVPFTLLPWGPAHVLWILLIAGCLFCSSFLIWDVSQTCSKRVPIFLICIVLANSEVLFSSGNLAGLAIGLCVVAVWCFLRERFVTAGILCFALSLVLKPHDSGPVWLFFLLGGAPHRKRALQTLVVALATCVPAMLWVSHIAPNWIPELRSNLSATSAHGDIRDPGPTSAGIHELEKIIDLQSVISVFRDDPHFYNPITYLLCGALFLVWAIRTTTSHHSIAAAWFALAVIVPLSMLVTYHRPYDAKLLLLTIPACSMLWVEGGMLAWLALLITTTGAVLTGDIPLAILGILTKGLQVPPTGIAEKLLTVLLARPVPLILLVMAIFYLCVYVRRSSGLAGMKENGIRNQPQFQYRSESSLHGI